MTPYTFAVRLWKAGAPHVVEVKQALDDVFLVHFEHRLSLAQAVGLQRAGFVFWQHAHRANFYQIRWTDPRKGDT